MTFPNAYHKSFQFSVNFNEFKSQLKAKALSRVKINGILFGKFSEEKNIFVLAYNRNSMKLSIFS